MNKNKSDAADEYLSKVIKRLEAEQYDVKSNIRYKNQYFEYVAKIKKFYVEKFTYFYSIFMFSKFSSLDINTFKDFISEPYKYAVKETPRPLPHGLFYGRKVYPVAVTDSVDYDTLSFIRKKTLPLRFIGSAEMPVIVILDTKELYYPKGSSLPLLLGGLAIRLLEDEMRHDINHMLAP